MTDGDAADEWWITLPPRRRAQIHRWIVNPEDPGEIPGQLELLDHEKGHTDEPST